MFFPPALRLLKSKKLGQVLRQREEVRDLADLHAYKANTPTMGGLCVWLSTILAAAIWAQPNVLLLATVFIFTAFFFIGLADDVAKLRRRNSRGISGRLRLLLEAAAIGAMLLGLCLWDADLYGAIHAVRVPAMTAPLIPHLATVLLVPFAFLVIAGSANAVNLTDGVDGLAAGCSISTALPLAIVCFDVATAVPGSKELATLLAALCGSLLVFFYHNCQPAKIFMGDCGSLALGGLFGVLSLLIGQPFLLAIIGGVFVVEALSVILQVYYFKISGGKRIFRMAPIHHHFELAGWPESRVVGRFIVASMVCAAVGLWLHFS